MLTTANQIEKLGAESSSPRSLVRASWPRSAVLSKRLSGHLGGETRVSDRDWFGPPQSLGEGRKHRQQQIEVALRDANQILFGQGGVALGLRQRQSIRTQWKRGQAEVAIDTQQIGTRMPHRCIQPLLACQIAQPPDR